MRRTGLWIPLLVALAVPLATAGQNAPAFYGMGDLPGDVGSVATAVSTDASTVVGHAEGGSGTQAVRWTEVGGLQGLGQPAAGEPFSRANGVSANGAVIVGTVATNNGGRAFRWTAGGGYTFLGTFTCFLRDGAATGEGVSGNGLVVVGSGFEYPFLGSPRVNAARWPSGGTGISNLGDLPGGGDAGVAQDATTTGSVIVGETDSGAGPAGFWWNGSMHALSGLPGAAYRTGALAISDNASTIVGEANSAPSGTNFPEPVRWTGASYGVIQRLGALPGQTSARGQAIDVTPDGALIVGSTRDLAGQDVAFLWDAANGMQSLAVVLEQEYGLDLGGWKLQSANGVSAMNGFGEFTVVGSGTNPSGDPEGFIAILSPTACNDGIDNDGDGLVDYPDDPDCTSPTDPSEDLACFDFVDNDGDGLTDYPLAYPHCRSLTDTSEAPECSDGIDNDGDGFIDFPDDPDCPGPHYDVESPTHVSIGDLLVVDRGQATLFAIDPADGSEHVVSHGAQLSDPEGLVQRADGRLVLSSPSGLFEVSLETGRQTRRSDPFVSAGGIPVAVDSAGRFVAHDAVGIHRATWNPNGTGVKTTLLTAPVGGNPGQLQIFTGFTLVLEDDDTALLTGFGSLGDGVFCAELTPPSVTKVTPSFLGHSWRDLALTSPGTLVAVGRHASLGEGVYCIDTSTGAVTALSTDPAWVQPDGVAVAAGGNLYVADSGTCNASGCSGGLVAQVHPVSGARSVIRSGGFNGTLQIAVVKSLPTECNDGIDNDGDGLVDLDDPTCWDPSVTTENPACDNDLDDDGDGKIDWDGGSGGGIPDPQCANKPWRTTESSSCGLGFELALLLPLLVWLRRRR